MLGCIINILLVGQRFLTAVLSICGKKQKKPHTFDVCGININLFCIIISGKFAVGDFIAQYHKTVAHMNVLYNNIIVINGNIVMRKVPVAAYSCIVKTLGKLSHRASRYTEYCRLRIVFLAEAFYIIVALYGNSTYRISEKSRVAVKDTYKLKASFLKRHM